MSKALELRDGWNNYNPKKEYERQKIDFGEKVIFIKFFYLIFLEFLLHSFRYK